MEKEIRKKVAEFYKNIFYMQTKLRQQVLFNIARAEFLRTLWDDEIKLLKKKDQKKYKRIDPTLVNNLLALYL